MARRKNMKSPAVALSLPAPVASSDLVARDPPVPQQSQTTEEILRELSPYEIEAAWILIGMKCDTVPPAASSRSNLMEQVLDQEGDASTRSASTTIAVEEQSQPASDDGSLTAGNESEVTNGRGEKLEEVEEKARDKPYDEVGAVTDENDDCPNTDSEDAVAEACSPCKSTRAKRPRDDNEDGDEDENEDDEDSNDDDEDEDEDDEYIPPSGRTRAKTQLQAETQSRSPKRQSSCAPKSKRPRLEDDAGSKKYTMPSTLEDISSWITENPVPEGLVLPIGENPRQCPKCLVIVLARERGSLKADVARHQRICKTELRFSCQVPYCGHKDDQRSNMHAHIRNNHFGKDLVSSRYRCTACGYMHLKAAPFFKHECFVDQEKNKHATLKTPS